MIGGCLGKGSLFFIIAFSHISSNVLPARPSYNSNQFITLIRTVMKRILFLLVLTLCTAALSAQREGLENFFSRYSGLEGYTSVTINGNLFGLFAKVDDDPELKDLANRITSVRIVSSENGKPHPGVSFASELGNVIRRGGYEELVKVKSDGDDVLILVKTTGETIREILIVSSGDEEAVIHIQGSLRQRDVDNLSRAHIDGLDQLEMLENAGK